jgi:NADPH:quinone reductase-like Zn-dependent oxidoreductase
LIDYTTRRFEDAVRDVEVALDTIGGEVQQRSSKMLRPSGIVISAVAPPSQEDAARHRARAALASSSRTRRT